MKTLFWLALLLPAPCSAVRVVMEGIPATNNAVYISTGGTGMNGAQVQLLANATAYNGGLSSVGVYVGSNVVVSDTNSTNKCVIYSSGSLTCLSLVGGGSGISSIAAANISAGVLGTGVIASSIAVNAVYTGAIAASAVTDSKINDVAAGKITGTLGVANGGTGATTLTSKGIIFGNGTSAVGITPAMANGGLVIGAGTSNNPSTGTITGTANQITVTNAAGSITLATPQNINTGASPTFNSLTLTNPLTVANGGTGDSTLTSKGIIFGNGTSAAGITPAMANGGLVIGAGTSTDPSTGTLTGTANQITITNAAGKITLSTPQNIDSGASPTFSALTLTNPLTVANGGSGAATLTSNGIIIGKGTSALTATPAMANGGLVIGAGTGVTPATGTLTGTASQIVVTNAAGSITLAGGGQDVTCGASQYLSAATWNKGIATGGTCTSAGTGNGDAVLSATQTFSGANTFTSSMTTGPTIYTTTATTSGAAVTALGSVHVNSWQIVASTNPSGASLIYFTGLQPDKRYRIEFVLRQATAGNVLLRFNNDNGTNYKFANTGNRSDTNAVTGNAGETKTECSLVAVGTTANGADMSATMEFQTSPSNAKIVQMMFSMSHQAGALFESAIGGCTYTGAANLSSATLILSAGTVTGYVYLHQRISALP